MPNPRFIGTSGFGLRGDAILEADWSVGQLLDALDRVGAAEDTADGRGDFLGPIT